MVRRVVSLLRRGPVALHAIEPGLDANAFAVASDVDLTVVLRGDALQLALVGGELRAGALAGVPLPPAASAQDLRGLLESGVRVLAPADDLQALGVAATDLVGGVQVTDAAEVAALLLDAEAVLTW